jgi:hypothetical protein
MPILNDIMDHRFIGSARRRGREEGEKRGKRIVLGWIGQRFGPIPDNIRKRIEEMPASRVEQIALRIFYAATLEELLREPARRRPAAAAKKRSKN